MGQVKDSQAMDETLVKAIKLKMDVLRGIKKCDQHKEDLMDDLGRVNNYIKLLKER